MDGTLIDSEVYSVDVFVSIGGIKASALSICRNLENSFKALVGLCQIFETTL